MHNAFFLKVQIHFIPAHCGAQEAANSLSMDREDASPFIPDITTL